MISHVKLVLVFEFYELCQTFVGVLSGSRSSLVFFGLAPKCFVVKWLKGTVDKIEGQVTSG